MISATELREFFERWGEVVQVAVSRANRELIRALARRERMQEERKVNQVGSSPWLGARPPARPPGGRGVGGSGGEGSV